MQHESYRVSAYRLVDISDQERFFFEIVKDAISDNFKCSFEKVLSHLSQGAQNLEPDHVRSLFFGDFANPDSNLKNYDEITDEVGLKTTMDSYLEEYNQMSTAPISKLRTKLF